MSTSRLLTEPVPSGADDQMSPSERQPQASVAAGAPHRLDEQVLGHLRERGYVPFHPVLANRFGHQAALFIGVALYWTRHGLLNAPQRGGWFHMSARQMSDATSLSRHQQDTVRAQLQDKNILQERLAGRPAVVNYRLNLRNLALALEVVDDPPENVSIEHAWSWFRQSVSFFRPLADLAGSAAGGLYLSWLLNQQRTALQALHPRMGAMLRIDARAATEALCLSPKVLRLARERLRKIGLITESGAHTVQVNMQAVLACIQQQAVPVLPKRRQAVSAARIDENDHGEPKKIVRPVTSPSITAPVPQEAEQRHLLSQRLLPLRPMAPRSLVGRGWRMTRVVMGQPVAGIPQLGASDPTSRSGALAHPQAVDSIAQSGKLGGRTGAQTGKLEAGKSAQIGKLGCPNRQPINK